MDSCGALYDPEIHSQFCPHILQAGVTGPSIAPDVPRATKLTNAPIEVDARFVGHWRPVHSWRRGGPGEPPPTAP